MPGAPEIPGGVFGGVPPGLSGLLRALVGCLGLWGFGALGAAEGSTGVSS
jgi:hypothetical protein